MCVIFVVYSEGLEYGGNIGVEFCWKVLDEFFDVSGDEVDFLLNKLMLMLVEKFFRIVVCFIIFLEGMFILEIILLYD